MILSFVIFFLGFADNVSYDLSVFKFCVFTQKNGELVARFYWIACCGATHLKVKLQIFVRYIGAL